MNLARLKTIRVVVSVLCFIVTGLLFLDIGNWIPVSVTSTIVAFQLVPAVTKTIAQVGLWTIGTIVILAVTLLFGRVCGTAGRSGGGGGSNSRNHAMRCTMQSSR
jgi:Flp pilus assembly protein protease CpaA